jgi:hypothetical protein
MSGTAFVVACSSRKAPAAEWERAREWGGMVARDAYAGQLFRMARAQLREAPGVRWVILSGKYGLLSPLARIDYYEQRIGEPRTLEEWPEAVERVGESDLAAVRGASRCVVIGSRHYGAAAAALLRRGVECPLEGLPVGRMLQAVRGLVARELARDLPHRQEDLGLAAPVGGWWPVRSS